MPTAQLGINYLVESQSSKVVSINTALDRLDGFVAQRSTALYWPRHILPGRIDYETDCNIDVVSSGSNTFQYMCRMTLERVTTFKAVVFETRGTAPVYTGGKGHLKISFYASKASDGNLRPDGSSLGDVVIQVPSAAWTATLTTFTPITLQPGEYWIMWQWEDGFSTGNYWGFSPVCSWAVADSEFILKSNSAVAYSSARPTFSGSWSSWTDTQTTAPSLTFRCSSVTILPA